MKGPVFISVPTYVLLFQSVHSLADQIELPSQTY
jgi:hypothetical protein